MATLPEQGKELWSRLPGSGKAAVISATLLTVAVIGAAIYYGSQPDYGVLFSDLKPDDAQNIVERLQASNVPYKLINGGSTISVPNEKISELRLQLAGSGVITGGHVGYDLFDKSNFGATDFAQQVNYRRAVEGELSKTLEGMEEVDSARVHISPKRESVFTEKEEGAKASVMLRVKQNKELAQERTDAIVSLITNSVEGLDPANVSVMDTKGRLLTAGKSKGGGFSEAGTFNSQLEARRKFEAETASRVVALLEPVAGVDRVRADVAADVDFSQIEETQERYNPQSQVVRSQQQTQETRTANQTQQNGGVVGARANDPTAQSAPSQPAAQNTNENKTQNTINYEIDKTTRRTIGGGGRVNRVTVSVLLDHKTVEGVLTPRTPEEIQQVQALVGNAVGIDAQRGDSVVVQTMPFDKPVNEEVPQTFVEKNKNIIAPALKYGALVLIAFLVFFFALRPARKALKAVIDERATEKLLPAASSAEQEKADSANRREMKAEEVPMLNNPIKESLLQEMNGDEAMTVAELEAKMDEHLMLEEAEPVDEFEVLRQTVIDHTTREPEVVVGTLRGWLRD